MALDEAAAEAAATAKVDALIAAHPEVSFSAATRAYCISYYEDMLLLVFDALKANAVVSPFGSTPSLNVGGTPVTGVGKLE